MGRKKRLGPFRRAVLLGLGILLPPLLTIVIFLWIAHTVGMYVLDPMERATRSVLTQMADIRTPDEGTDVRTSKVTFNGTSYDVAANGKIEIDGKEYRRTPDGHVIPEYVYHYVQHHIGKDAMPGDARGIYTWYIDHYWLPRRYVVPLFLCIFLLILYLLGKFMAAGVGRFFVHRIERLIHRLPLVRNVCSSLK